MSSPLPDAAPTNWVDRWAPARLKPWLQLGRFDRPAGIWLLMLPGWQGVALASAAGGRWPSPWLLFLFFVGAAVMRAAGCAYNDVVDRDLDRKVARTAGRPVASGRISRGAALVYAVGLSLLGLTVLLQLNRTAQLIGVASLALVAAYPFMKRITWWPQAWLGLTFNWGALVGMAAAYPTGAPGHRAEKARHAAEMLGDMPNDLSAAVNVYWVDTSVQVFGVAAVLLYLSGVFWTLGYDTIYALQDLEDDALAGVKSSARRLGPKVKRGIAWFYLVAILLSLAAWTTALLEGVFLPWSLFAFHLVWQVRTLRPDDPADALRKFKSNVMAGLLLFLAFALGPPLHAWVAAHTP